MSLGSDVISFEVNGNNAFDVKHATSTVSYEQQAVSVVFWWP